MFLSKNFFKNLHYIRSLQLAGCDFTNVSNDAFQSMGNLEVLEIKNAKNMSHIEFKGLKKLKWLRFELIEYYIPLFDQVNPGLQVLELDLRFRHDLILKLFENFNFRYLKAFIFYKCYDFDLNWLICNSAKSDRSSLRYLCLGNLKSLKGSWTSFENLRTLDLSETWSFDFQIGMFNGLANLNTLDISRNKSIGEQLAPGLFNELVSLEQLYISSCSIKTLPDNLFSTLTRLKVLDLSDNSIAGVNAKTFEGIENLNELRFYQYRHDCDNLSVFIYFKKLQKVILNPSSTVLAEQIRVKFPDIEIRFERI